ncbi:MAG: type IV pilus biogenesis/stability protein PilW, partial [Betaproteobacteria bacterium HGW-Betaproteobacteria-21]
MTFRMLPLVLLVSVLGLGGCVTAPTSSISGDAVGVSRPMSDVQPAAGPDARARVHVDLGQAYF